ncbi:hypothetical protein C1X05_00185 [Laceyella sacchari]|nr:hypothetical protein C1X05_00185 [Laceyella sacchari]
MQHIHIDNLEEDVVRLQDDTVRYVLRKRRIKELHKTMDELQDHTISKGTISNIEKAKGKVSPKTLEIYLDKLELTEDEVLRRVKIVQEEMNEYYDQLEAIETILNRGFLDTAKKQLERFQLEEYHPLTPFLFFLQGRICFEEKDIKKAEDNFHTAIKLCKDYRLNPKDNLIAACYAELGRSRHKQDDMKKAIKFVDQGLSNYDETKGKREIKFRLLGNKTLYLLKSSQNDQASWLLDKVWTEVEGNFYDDYSVLNLYKFRSMFLRDKKLYDEAHQCCHKGMQIARNHWSHRIGRYLDFLIISGSIYLKQGELKKALDRFQLALDSDVDYRAPRRHMDAHTYLGILFNTKKKWSEATIHLDEAIRIGREESDAFRLVKALIVRGNVYFLQDQFSEALPYYEEAVEISKKYGYKQREYTALLKSADCFDNLDEKERRRDCLDSMYRLQKDLQIKSEDEIYEV